jgi:hypothetical protein
LFRKFYGRHDDVLVVSSEIGLLFSVVAFFLVLFVKRMTWRIALAVVTLVLGYLWFSSLLWWVMVK